MSDKNASDAKSVSLFDDVSVLAGQFLPAKTDRVVRAYKF